MKAKKKKDGWLGLMFARFKKPTQKTRLEIQVDQIDKTLALLLERVNQWRYDTAEVRKVMSEVKKSNEIIQGVIEQNAEIKNTLRELIETMRLAAGVRKMMTVTTMKPDGESVSKT